MGKALPNGAHLFQQITFGGGTRRYPLQHAAEGSVAVLLWRTRQKLRWVPTTAALNSSAQQC
jgi:hypothetical protein